MKENNEMTTTETIDPKLMNKLIENRFPEKWGYTRKISNVFENYFRIDYYCEGKDNKITESHFISVTTEGVNENPLGR
jgi:hypothetical protein